MISLASSRAAAVAGDAAVRYWAATGLLALGNEAKSAEPALRKAIQDPAVNVRLVAAVALCRLGHEQEALPVIVAALEDANIRTRLQAAIILSALGEKASTVAPAMKKAHAAAGPGNYAMYLRWALERALGGGGE